MASGENTKVVQSYTYADPGYLMLIVYTLSIAVLIFLSWVGSARAIPEGNEVKGDAVYQEMVSPNEVRQGELLLPGAEPGKYRAAPMLSMDVDSRVRGIVARATVKQHFTNDSDQWVEALYAFPLPDDSAIDHLEMRINDRIIIGKIQRKEVARQTYEAAKKEGKKASLLLQLRPNIFTTAVANIAPGEDVIIDIQYQQVVQRQDNVYSLRFPMTVGPRYTPESSFSSGDVAQYQEVGEGAAVNPVSLKFNLAAGMVLSRVDSLYHSIAKNENEDSSLDIRFTGEVKADRDFVLEWEPKAAQAPSVTLFSEQRGTEQYMLLMVMPPEHPQREPLAREVIFILDTSGSMGGESIRQAQKALLMAVKRMRPQDRFNVIEFNSNARALFADPQLGNQKNIGQAVDFIDRLEADGGTEIRKALELALDGKKKHERIRQIVFLTDGSVSNEEELFTLVRNKLGDSRLFTVGIGSAPNSYFMTRAARMGRGTYSFIGKLDEVQGKMTALFSLLEQPAVTNLQLGGVDGFEIFPSPLPDLYHGEPLTVVMKGEGSPKHLFLAGQRDGVQPWRVAFEASHFTHRPGIVVLWAREKIRMLMDSLTAGVDPQQIEEKVTELALENHLVSRYTSLVAVEEQVSRPANKDIELHTQKVKVNLPAGWVHDKVFAGGAGTATPASLLLLVGFILLSLSVLLIWIQRRRQ